MATLADIYATQYTPEYNAQRAGYQLVQPDDGPSYWLSPDGERVHLNEDEAGPGGTMQVESYRNHDLNSIGYDQYEPSRLMQQAQKLGVSPQEALQIIYGQGTSVVNDPNLGPLIKAGTFDPNDGNFGWKLPSLEDKSFLSNYGGALLMLPAVGNIAAAAGAAGGTAGAAGGAANTGLFASGSYAPVTDAVASGAAGAEGAATGFNAASVLNPEGFSTLGGNMASNFATGGNYLPSAGGTLADFSGAGAGASFSMNPVSTASTGASFYDKLLDPRTLVSGAASLGSAYLGNQAANKAADIQSQATDKALAQQQGMFDTLRADQAPWRTAGADAITRLSDMTKPGGFLMTPFTGADLQNEPGYQFGLNQGVTAVDRSAASRGGLNSGATLKALTRFGTDYAGTKYNDAFNRDLATKNQQYNTLAGISGAGQQAQNQVNSVGMNFSNNASNLTTSGGAARAAGVVGGTNAITSGLSSFLKSMNDQQILDAMTAQRPYYGGYYAG